MRATAMKDLEAQRDIAPIGLNADFAVESGKRAAIREQLNLRVTELRDIESRLAIALANDDAEVESISARILAGEELDGTLGRDALMQRAERLRIEIRAYRAADVHQRDKVTQIRAELSLHAAAELGPAHRQAVARILAAVRELADASAAAEEVRTGLQGAGYDQCLPDLRAPNVLKPDLDLLHSAWLRNANAYVGGGR